MWKDQPLLRRTAALPALLTLGLLAVGGIVALPRPALAAAPEVMDDGDLFSEEGERRANQIIDDIYRNTSPRKDVAVETYTELPKGSGAEAFIEERFRKRTVDGLLVLVTKKERKLLVTVGKHTQQRFGGSEVESMRQRMLGSFKKNDFDGGLIAGLEYARGELKRDFPIGGTRSASPTRDREVFGGAPTYRERSSSGSSGCSGVGLIGILIAVGLIWLIVGLIRGIYRAVTGGGSATSGPTYSGSYSGGGYGGSTGGGFGWGKAIVGGLFGAVAGNWLYDRFFNDHSHGSDYVGNAYADNHSESYTPPSDSGDVGSTFGGGGGSDWGGSDSGGSDWGGGGDSGGGGGDW